MATRQVSTRNMVGLKSLSFIRPQTVSFKIAGTKPLTRLYAFFDGVGVDVWITPTGGSLGNAVTTNSAGEASGTFSIPSMTFNTGERILKFQDSPSYEDSSIPGSLSGSASAKYTANGMQQTYQETINNVNQIVTVFAPAPAQSPSSNGNGGSRDPLAQSFFTYGVTNGCYVTKVDLFFQSKDTSIPVTLEIREMENGFPSGKRVSIHSTLTKSPADVFVSSNAATPTTFTFSRPIYLAENRDYCLVLLSNSNKYHVWTSKLGETSVETGKAIFEQPFIGTLFKSENNITWTAEQTEDIKFTLYKANFTSLTGATTYKANSPITAFPGTLFTVTSGSPVISAKFPIQHGYKTGDFMSLAGKAGETYRGIPNATISNPVGFAVTVIDAYNITFSVGVNATSSGTLEASGVLNHVYVNAQGSGYVSPSITFSGGGGTGAAATAVVSGGKIISVTVTNPGSGYTSTPTLLLTDGSGSGAQLQPVSEATFAISLNRKFQEILPDLVIDKPPSTDVSGSTKTSSESYVVGEFQNSPIKKTTNVGKLAALVSPLVETASFGASNATEFVLNMTSDSPNVSPLLDIGQVPSLRARNMLINDITNSASELTPASGTAQARYISQINTVETLSKDIRVLVEAASNEKTSFEVFVRTSVSGSTIAHTDRAWVKLVPTSLTSLSPNLDEYRDYTFNTGTSLEPFDVYDIKIVLYTSAKYAYPKIANYRSIVLAT